MKLQWSEVNGAASGDIELNSIGEGVVWNCITPGWQYNDFMFKCKGARHAGGAFLEGPECDRVTQEAIINFCQTNKCREFTFEFLSE